MFSFSCASIGNVSVEAGTHPQIIAEKAYDEFGNKNYRKAIAYYQYIIDNFSKEDYAKEVAWAYYEIGFCYYYQNKFKEAINYLNVVINDFAIIPPRVLSQKVLEDIYKEKPNLRPVENIEESIETGS